MKRWLLGILGLLVLLIVVVVVIGAFLPEQHVASRTLKTKQQPQAIWDAINDHANEPNWRTDVESVQSLGEREGKPVWQERYKDGNQLSLMTTESKPPNRMVRELVDLDGPFSGRWEIDIQSLPQGSTVKITEVGKVSNPIFRFVSRFVIGHTTQMEKYLTNLAAKFGEQPEFVQ
ncbi:MAG TPA: SRPBCC family protein [Pyrinomonadaceae bacterium]|jgi:hypothetical protein